MNIATQHSLSVARWSVAMAPASAALRRRLAERLIEAGDAAEAAERLAGLPDDTAAQVLRGIALHDLGDMAGAHDSFRRVTEQAPEAAAGWANLGLIGKIEGRFDDAIAAYDRAVSLAPDDPRIRLNRAIALLRAGRMSEAWADYESRFRLGGRAPRFGPDRMLPPIDGLTLTGTTILATHEDGFGDTLQFCRYLPLLAARGARVVALVPRSLCRLLRTLEGVEAVIGPGDPLPPFDHHIPMFSLPRVFATRLDTIPAATRYLDPDPTLAVSWAARLPVRRGLRVGIVWAGQARPWAEGFTALDRRRAIPLAAFTALAGVPGLDLVSLQIGPAAADIAGCGFDLHDPTGHDPTGHDPTGAIADFADTAAIIANLDVVVTVDTAAAHLAGAIGAPVCLLDRYDSCWRWLSGRTDSPWYPSLRIFRQPAPADWSTVMGQVLDHVCHLAGVR